MPNDICLINNSYGNKADVRLHTQALPGLHEKKRPFELTTYRIPPLQNIL